MDLLMLRIKPGISQIPENIVTIWFLLPLMMFVLKWEFYPFEVKDLLLSQGIMCMISRLFLIFASKVQK